MNWDRTDFIVMGLLIFGTLALYAVISRTAPRKYRLPAALALAALFLFIWAELAVGVFTDLGS